jgi:ATP-binding cassette, subfamily B, multidrug efflux pump
MLRHARAEWRLYTLGILALFVVDFLDSFAPKIIQWSIEDLQTLGSNTTHQSPIFRHFPQFFGPTHFLSGMWLHATLYLVLVAVTGFFRFHMSFGFSRAGVNVIHRLRGKLFSHLQQLPASYHDKNKIGAQLTLATADIDSCRMFYSFGLLMLLDTLFYFLFIPSFMLSINAKLLVASLLTLPLMPFIITKLTHIVENRYEQMQKEFEILSERARESFAGAKVIKSFVQEESEAKAFAQVSEKYIKSTLQYARIVALENPLWVLLFGLVDLVAVLYGGRLVLQGEISVGAYAAFFQYLVRLSGPMMVLGWVIAIYQRANVSVRRIEDVLHAPCIPTIAHRHLSDPQKISVRCEHLTFAYGDKPVLRNVQFSLAAGQTLGIVGPVGSGKSTLLQLLSRLYEPPRNTLFLNDVDITELGLAELRQLLAVVPQETFLFSDTILENISIGARADVSNEALLHWSKVSQIDSEILRFPKGYETLLGEKGVNLSGGQKQRLAIARALARRPGLLLLDDCLSSVDTQTEKAILRGLKQVAQHCTIIIVSHRLSSVKNADEIIVLDEGQIVERGTHAELLKHRGYYAGLYAKQQIEQQLEVTP